MRRIALFLGLLLLTAAAPAHVIRLGGVLAPVDHNPADALRDEPFDPVRYDPASTCRRRTGAGPARS